MCKHFVKQGFMGEGSSTVGPRLTRSPENECFSQEAFSTSHNKASLQLTRIFLNEVCFRQQGFWPRCLKPDLVIWNCCMNSKTLIERSWHWRSKTMLFKACNCHYLPIILNFMFSITFITVERDFLVVLFQLAIFFLWAVSVNKEFSLCLQLSPVSHRLFAPVNEGFSYRGPPFWHFRPR